MASHNGGIDHLVRTTLKNLKALTFALCMTTSVAFAHPVLAQDATDFASKLSAAYGALGYTIEFGAATADGDTISFDGVTVTMPAYAGAAEPFKVPTVFTFNGVAEQDDGSYTADSLTVPDVAITEDGYTFSAKSIAATDLFIPATPAGNIKAVLQLFAGLSTGAISVAQGDKELFSIASITSATEFTPEQGTPDLASLSASADVDGISIDLSTVTEAEPKAIIDALGLTKITGSLTETADWTMADGRMSIGEVALDLDNLGKISFALDIAGYTPELMDQMTAQQVEFAKLPEADRAAKEEAAAMEMASKLSISSFSLRFDDASLTNKLLDFAAAQQGADRATFVAGLKAIVPAMLMQSGSEDLVKQATAAVTAFLDDPKSLEVSIDPGRDVNFMELAAGAADPAGTIKTLNVQITANEAAE
jgi:hypothetical protein